jgi:cysteine-rich repeat protein
VAWPAVASAVPEAAARIRTAREGTGPIFTLPDAATGSDVAQSCVKTAAGSCCGNSTLDQGEGCDDGNTVGGDGCSPQCTIETNYVCSVPGQPCVSTVRCGDGRISGTEQCDDGNTLSGDGCDSTCQLELGWTCPVVDAACVAAACGDGIVAGNEQCDDGNTISGDGCTATCQLEPGYACGPDQWHPTALSTECYPTVCGDGNKEGTEQCDDGNTVPFDGCSPTCTNEPKCGYPNGDSTQPYQCFSVCGDGIKMPDEACDDGNNQDGDGCSSTCTIESGYACTVSEPTLGSSLTVPILYRDFNWHHPQFEVDPVYAQRQAGIANSAIGVNGKPVYNTAYVGNNAGTSLDRPWTMDGPPMNTNSATMSDATGATFYTKSASNTPASLTSPPSRSRTATRSGTPTIPMPPAIPQQMRLNCGRHAHHHPEHADPEPDQRWKSTSTIARHSFRWTALASVTSATRPRTPPWSTITVSRAKPTTGFSTTGASDSNSAETMTCGYSSMASSLSILAASTVNCVAS